MKEDWQTLRSTFDREGYGIARNVLDSVLVAEVQGHVHWLLNKHPDKRQDELHAELAALRVPMCMISRLPGQKKRRLPEATRFFDKALVEPEVWALVSGEMARG
jgi:hypothetical protein